MSMDDPDQNNWQWESHAFGGRQRAIYILGVRIYEYRDSIVRHIAISRGPININVHKLHNRMKLIISVEIGQE